MRIGVFIGRLQPLHNAHLTVIKMALKQMDHLVLVLGSASQAKTVKNPWTTQERTEMVLSCLTPDEQNRISIIPTKDYLYNDTLWLASLQAKLSTISVKNNFRIPKDIIDIYEHDVVLYGHDKDRSTFYLHLFPQWEFYEVGCQGNFSGTKIREYYFRKDTLDLKNICPEPVFIKLKDEINKSNEEYQRLYNEAKFIWNYKEQWSSSPFPPIFVTVDAVVIKSGHVLVGRRKGQLGKGLLALPGGFINNDEGIIESCLRELKEETRIGIPKDELKKRVRDNKVFDHPYRSLRGRTITHAYCFDLGSGNLPKIKGDDDMEKAQWMPLCDVNKFEEEFFEDHWHIINYFTSRY